jgi:DNA repair exonuclease SbcCD ATPase subunit
MTINSVSIKNFMNISEANLTFKPGINVLLGINGSGKSAVLEAIAYCILDRKKADSWKDYIKTGTSGFEINLSITDDAGEIMTFDYKGKSTTSKKIEYKGIPYHGENCAIFLKSKFDSEMLENVVFSLQGSKNITSITPAERRSIFKKIFNSDFTEQSDKIKKDISEEENKQKNLESTVSVLQGKTYPFSRLEVIDEEAYGKFLLEKEILLNKLAEEQKEELKASEYRSKEQEVSSLVKRITSLKEKLSKFEEEQKKIISVLPTINKSINTIDEERNKIIDDKGEASKNLKELNELLPIDTKEVIIAIEAFEEKITKLKTDISIATTHLETHKKGLCTQCGQETKVTEVPVLEKKLELYGITLKSLVSGLSESKSILKSLQDTQVKRASDILSLKNKIESFTNSIQNKQVQKKNEEDKIAHFKLMFDTAEKEKTSVTSEINQTNESILLLQTWINENKITSIGSSTTKDSLTLVDTNLKLIEDSRIKNKERKVLNDKLLLSQAEDKRIIEESFIQINESKSRAALLTTTRTLFDIEIPNYINNKTCSILQSYLNDKFLNVTKEGLQVELQQDKKGINFVYKAEKDSQWLNTKLASGFEESLLTVAFKASVALAYQSGMLILDEPDKTATDESSRKLFDSLLSINKGFQQMFVITHKEEAVEFLKDAGAQVYYVHKGVFNIQY